MSEEFNEGMNENRGMAEEHKGPEENPSITETPGSVNFTMKEAAEEKTNRAGADSTGLWKRRSGFRNTGIWKYRYSVRSG